MLYIGHVVARRKNEICATGCCEEEEITSEEQKSAHPFNVRGRETLRMRKEERKKNIVHEGEGSVLANNNRMSTVQEEHPFEREHSSKNMRGD